MHSSSTRANYHKYQNNESLVTNLYSCSKTYKVEKGIGENIVLETDNESIQSKQSIGRF